VNQEIVFNVEKCKDCDEWILQPRQRESICQVKQQDVHDHIQSRRVTTCLSAASPRADDEQSNCCDKTRRNNASVQFCPPGKRHRRTGICLQVPPSSIALLPAIRRLNATEWTDPSGPRDPPRRQCASPSTSPLPTQSRQAHRAPRPLFPPHASPKPPCRRSSPSTLPACGPRSR
jgi:hypothetical protein